jgi:Tol biopolymer transport system component
LWFDRKGKELGSLGSEEIFFDVRLSPDNEKMAVTAGAKTNELWIYDTKYGGRRRLASLLTAFAAPVWSADGKQLAFSSATGLNLKIVTIATETDGSPSTVAQSGMRKVLGDWSKDGTHLVYHQFDFFDIRHMELWVVPLKSSQQPFRFRKTSAADSDARLSPDGKWIIFTSTESGQKEIRLASFPSDSKDIQVSVAGGTFPFWSADGSEMFYLGPDNQLMAIPFFAEGAQIHLGPVRALFQTKAKPTASAIDVSRDGQRFLVNSQVDGSRSLSVILNWSSGLKAKASF